MVNVTENNNKEKLVSIIMPAYNSGKYISESIASVREQSYINWELIIVDDCSSDNTIEIVKKFQEKDHRILLFTLTVNSGAAKARNIAIKKASGVYLAFLDSDDYWDTDKLSDQIAFMEGNGYTFTCTTYSKVNEAGNKAGNNVVPKLVSNYRDVLENSPGNSTVIYNCIVLGKFYSPDIRRRNDFVMWLQVIKAAKKLYGIQKAYTFYRVREDSLSKKKFKLLKYQWRVYREYEKLPILYSIYFLTKKILDVIISKLEAKKQ